MIKPNKSLILLTTPTVILPAVTWDTVVTGSGGELDASVTLSGSNLIATAAASGDRGDSATTGKTSGKWYFEVLTGASWSGGDTGIGFLKALQSHANFGSSGTLGWAMFPSGSAWNGASLGNTGLGAFAAAKVVGFALDLDNNRVWGTFDGVSWTFGGTPGSATNAKSGGWTIGNTVKPAFCLSVSGISLTGRFKAADFTLAIPAGFSAYS